MYLLSGHLLGIACAARDRAIETEKSNPDAFPGDATVAIILSAAATEGFINEVPTFIRKLCNPMAQPFRKLTPQMATFADALIELEKNRASPKVKYIVASLLLSGEPFDQGKNPFQDFALLIKLQDDHMHMKLDESLTNVDGNLVNNHPSYVRDLQNRGLARKMVGKIIAPWVNTLQTAEMAKWAVETARNIIFAVLDMTPDTDNFYDDPFGSIKVVFRPAQKFPKPWD